MKKFLTKAKTWLGEKKSKVFAACASSFAVAGTAMSAFAAEGDSDVVTGITDVTSAITSQFNMTTIVQIVGIVLAACVGLFLFWWGARKVITLIMNAFKGRGVRL